ncbi:large ribosomal subunit protein bL17m-like isoform X1 [Babylonia areolata]|uniref:large ribosomal subunit protein bL17m-like isoform X1 n=1 Tax=Babylonia areolata TaxID=304850 RepID=UPI003FD176C9
MLRFRVRLRPRKLSKVEGLGAGPEGRLKRLRKHVTALIRHERVESSFAQCDEARGYAEKLIQMAVRNGDTHKHTMEMADHWLLEKDLIHKLFKVLVPRYSSFPAAATSIHKISGLYPGDGVPMGVLELKGNPWPSVRPQPRDTSLLLHNILLQEARQDFHAEQQADTSSACPLSGQPSGLCPDGSSVDGPARPGETDPSDREKTPSYMQTKGGL